MPLRFAHRVVAGLFSAGRCKPSARRQLAAAVDAVFGPGLEALEGRVFLSAGDGMYNVRPVSTRLTGGGLVANSSSVTGLGQNNTGPDANGSVLIQASSDEEAIKKAITAVGKSTNGTTYTSLSNGTFDSTNFSVSGPAGATGPETYN